MTLIYGHLSQDIRGITPHQQGAVVEASFGFLVRGFLSMGFEGPEVVQLTSYFSGRNFETSVR